MEPATDHKALIIERYESLRVLALDRQQKHIHWQNDHTRFIHTGMSSWIAEETTKAPVEPKVDVAFVNFDQKNDFQPDCEPQLMQTIADILLKKIKENNKCYC